MEAKLTDLEDGRCVLHFSFTKEVFEYPNNLFKLDPVIVVPLDMTEGSLFMLSGGNTRVPIDRFLHRTLQAKLETVAEVYIDGLKLRKYMNLCANPQISTEWESAIAQMSRAISRASPHMRLFQSDVPFPTIYIDEFYVHPNVLQVLSLTNMPKKFMKTLFYTISAKMHPSLQTLALSHCTDVPDLLRMCVEVGEGMFFFILFYICIYILSLHCLYSCHHDEGGAIPFADGDLV